MPLPPRPWTACSSDGGVRSAQTEGHRAIRSFVRREGRLTAAQARALDRLWPRYGVEPLALAETLDRLNRLGPVTLEIGFGNGEGLLELAMAHPGRQYLGIDVYRPGIGRLLQALEQQDIENVRVIQGDATECLPLVPTGALDEVLVFFPDPWPKKRHHKRRLIQAPFVRELGRVLHPGGRLHLATDWEDYARHMVAVLEQNPEFENPAGPGHFSERPRTRPLTRFERRGLDRGHAIFDLLYVRRPGVDHRAD